MGVLDRFELDAATADALLALADPGLRAEAIARFDGGANSAVFEVRTTGGTALVVKVYADILRWKLKKERFVYGLLAGRPLTAPVPAILASDDSGSLLRQHVLVMTRLEGAPVQSLLDVLDDRELAEVTRQLGVFLESLHQVVFDRFGEIGAEGIVGAFDTNLDYMRDRFERRLGEFAKLGGDDGLRARIERHVAEREELLAGCTRASFCHNDCHYGNVLALPEAGGWRMSGMLDFENALAGDPLLDLAKAYCYAPHRDVALLAALAEGYGELRPDWRPALDLYVVFHSLELWVWYASLGESWPLDALADEIRLLTR